MTVEIEKFLVITTLSTVLKNGELHELPYEIQKTKGNKNLLEVKGMLNGCKQLRKGFDIKIIVNTSNTYITTCIKNLEKWQQSGWITSKGKEVKHKKEWQEIYELTKNFEIEVKSGCDVAKAEVAPVQPQGEQNGE